VSETVSSNAFSILSYCRDTQVKLTLSIPINRSPKSGNHSCVLVPKARRTREEEVMSRRNTLNSATDGTLQGRIYFRDSQLLMAQELVGVCVLLWLLPALNSVTSQLVSLQPKGKKTLHWDSPTVQVKGSRERRKARLLFGLGIMELFSNHQSYHFPACSPGAWSSSG
jgi:hypothetical protein